MLNAVDFNAKAQVSVPSGLKSTSAGVKLHIVFRNERNNEVQIWWVDYSGNPRFYGKIPSRGAVLQNTYGTHPWLVTETNGNVITYLVPNTSDLECTVQ